MDVAQEKSQKWPSIGYNNNQVQLWFEQNRNVPQLWLSTVNYGSIGEYF